MADSASQQTYDWLVEHQIDLLRFERRTLRGLFSVLDELSQEIADEILAAQATQHRRLRLEQILTIIYDLINETYTGFSDEFTDTLADLAGMEANAAAIAVNTVIGAELVNPVIAPALLNALATETVIDGVVTGDYWKKQQADYKRLFAVEMRKGIIKGETVQQLVKRITDKDGEIKNIADLKRRQVESLVRTSVNAVTSEARDATWRANKNVIKGYQHVSTLDKRTTIQCAARDNLIWDIDKKPVGHSIEFKQTPIHWGCRSLIVPWLKGYSELNKNDRRMIKPSTRASMDGQVSESLNFNDFLKTKSDAFINEYLGAERAKLFREGKIEITDMVDDQGEMLTLKQIKEKIGIKP